MINHTKSPQTAAAIAVAMELACAAGDLETAERLFECFRLLFADYQAHESASCASAPISEAAMASDSVKVVQWW